MLRFRSTRRAAPTSILLLSLVAAACTAARSELGPQAAPTTTTAAPTTTAPTSTTTTTAPPVVTAPATRWVLDTGYRPLLSAAGVVVHYPTARVERVGFHQSKKAGARWMDLLPTAGEAIDLPSRERSTPGRTAADVLSDPAGEVRAPVTGRVIRGGTYVLYCKHSDSFLVIEPDAHPGWEVKVLHISGLLAGVGQRVEAGVTLIAAHPTRLPFKSQVEDFSAAPAWPHVHLEVVDPSIKNPPGVGGKPCS